jgi:hypothetical protein
VPFIMTANKMMISVLCGREVGGSTYTSIRPGAFARFECKTWR